MTDKKTEALKLALEALEYMAEDLGRFPSDIKAITTIREALAEESSGTEQTAQPQRGLVAHGNAEDLWAKQTEHLNCPACGGSGHVEDIMQRNFEFFSILRQWKDGLLFSKEAMMKISKQFPPAQQHDYRQQCHKESLPTYGSEEVRKLREVIKSQAKIITQLDQPQKSIYGYVSLENDKFQFEEPEIGRWVRVYTSPPASKPWVGLPMDEFKYIASKYILSAEAGLEYFQEEIEAKLREKNA